MGRRRGVTTLRSPVSRAKMWDRKMSGEVYAAYLEAVKEDASLRMMGYQASYQHVLDTVREVLQGYGSEAFLLQEYMWYALKLWSLTQRYRGNALQVHADALFLRFLALGRPEELLRKIAYTLGIKISPWSVLLDRLGIVKLGVLQVFAVWDGARYVQVEACVKKVDYTYDAEGRLETETLEIMDVNGVQYTIRRTYSYDAAGNLVSIGRWEFA